MIDCLASVLLLLFLFFDAVIMEEKMTKVLHGTKA